VACLSKKIVKVNGEEKLTRNPNGAGSVFQRKDGRFVGQIQIGVKENGRQIYKTFYGKSSKEVQRKLDDFKQTENTTNKENNPYMNMYFDEYIRRWLNDVKSNTLKPASYDTLENIVENHIVTTIGHYKLSEISSQIIQKEAINKAKEKGLSFSIIKKVYNTIKACYKYAEGDGHITVNPTTNLVLPSQHQFDTKEIRVFTDEELDMIIEIATSKCENGTYRYPLGYGFVFILNTGLRVGEAIALLWKDVDFEKKAVHINKNAIEAINRSNEESASTKYKTIVQKSAKTKSGNRVVPLNKAAIEALEKLKEIRYFGENSNIFSTESNTMYIRKNLYDMFNRIYERGIVDKAIKEATEKVEKTKKKNRELSSKDVKKIKDKTKQSSESVGLHALRHTFASKLFEKGIDVKVISELLGHANIGVTYDTYVHLIDSKKTDAVMALDWI
jgi:integrase